MSVASQTFSRSDLREWAFTINKILPREIEHTFSHSPALALFANQTLGDFGGVQLRGRGHRTHQGGESITFRVTLGEHAGARRMTSGYGKHTVAPDSNTRLATANWKWYSHALAVSTHEMQINRGPQAVASFLQSQTRGVVRALANMVADDMYSTTLATGAISSLDTLISAASENTNLQSLSRSTYDKYNARGLSAVGTAPASVSFASGSFAAQGISDMLRCFNNASEGMIQPDVALTDYATHERYEGALQPQERFQGAVRVADGSFRALAFRDKPVIPDRKCTANTIYFVSVGGDEGVNLDVLSGSDFDFDEWKDATEQRVMIRPLFLTANLTIGNAQFGSNKMNSITD